MEVGSKSKALSRSLAASAALPSTLYSMARWSRRSADSPSFLMRSVSSSISCSGPSCAQSGAPATRQQPSASPRRNRHDEWMELLVFKQKRGIDQEIEAVGAGRVGFNGEDVHPVAQMLLSLLEGNINRGALLAGLDFLGIASAAAADSVAGDLAAVDIGDKAVQVVHHETELSDPVGLFDVELLAQIDAGRFAAHVGELGAELAITKPTPSRARPPGGGVKVRQSPVQSPGMLSGEVLPGGVFGNQDLVINWRRGGGLCFIGVLLVFRGLPRQGDAGGFDLAALDDADEVAGLARAIDHGGGEGVAIDIHDHGAVFDDGFAHQGNRSAPALGLPGVSGHNLDGAFVGVNALAFVIGPVALWIAIAVVERSEEHT